MRKPSIDYFAVLVLFLGIPCPSDASDKHKPNKIKGAENNSREESDRQLFYEDEDTDENEELVRKDPPLVSKDDMRLPYETGWEVRFSLPTVSNMPSESPSSLPSVVPSASINPSRAPTQPLPTAEPTLQVDRPLKCVQTKSGSELTVEHTTRFYKGDVHCLSIDGQEVYFGYTWTNLFGLFVNGQSVWEIPQYDLVASGFRWTFQADGNLVLRDENDIVIWMTGSCCSSGSQLKVSTERVWIENSAGSQLWSEPFYVTPPPSAPPPPTPPPTRPPIARPNPSPNPPPNDTTISFVPGQLTRNQNGLNLSKGLTSRIIARTNQKVRFANGSTSRESFHGEPDGAAVFADPDSGGWIYVSNSEENGGSGGVGAIYFSRNGDVVDYKTLLQGTTRNCSGGKTPWNTWVSCEEHRNGKIWQVDPKGRRSPQKTSLSPDTGDFESFAYDVRNRKKPRFFVTEDNNQGALRRFTPSNPDWNDPWNMLHGTGTLEYLVLEPRNGDRDGTYYWTSNRSRARGNAESFYRYSEGLDVHDNELFFTSKTLKSLFILNLDGNTYKRFSTDRGLFDGQPDQMQRLVKDSNSLLYFCEDGGKEAGIHARDRNGWFYTILEATMNNRETSGLAFSPDGKHMYFAYQMRGIIFDVWREDGLPFHGQTLDVHYHEKR